MNNKFFISVLALLSVTTFANEDLNLGGQERWEAKSTGYICDAYKSSPSAPKSHENLNVEFEVLRTDKTLDNGLVLATFNEGTSQCRYSALLFADNAASTIRLVESKAYAINGSSDCIEGKELLDNQLFDNDYLYWGHPHHVSIMMPVQSAKVICGEGATHVGLDFTVSKFLGNR